MLALAILLLLAASSPPTSPSRTRPGAGTRLLEMRASGSGPVGGLLFDLCADLTFSATAAALPASSCQNSTGVGGVAIANVAANANGPATAMNTTAAVQTGGAGRDVVGAGRVLGPFAAAAAAVVAVGLL
ncbi:hypothetical protein BJ546DRAFT_1062902 [Cryomyces antarcticus]